MDLKLPALICFLLILQGSCTTKVQQPRMLTTDYVTKSGSVPIQKDRYGYYVNADLLYNYDDASDSEVEDPSRGQWNLGLYTSVTLFSSSCQSFNYYPCSSFGCTDYTGYSSTPSFPDFNVLSGHPIAASLYLDYGNWELASGNAVLAGSCDYNTYSGYGYDRYGIIGLGFNDDQTTFLSSQSNYINSTTFSISLERNGSSGTLLFWSNEEITYSGSFIGQLSATEDLLVTPTSVTIDIGSSSVSTTTGLMFDLNSQGIGLPSSIYYDIINDLESIASTSCDSTSYSSYCSYNGEITDLPTITITIQGVSIPIPPTVYVQGVTDDDTWVDGIDLNFRLVDPSYSGYNYVTSTFSNYIILDSSIMSYYYTEFSYNSGSPTITLYNPSSSPSSKVVWPYIVGGVIGGIVILVIICCCCARRRKNRLTQEATRRPVNGDVSTSDQAPLVTVPYSAENQAYAPQAFSNYGYEQNNYGYPQYPNQDNAVVYGAYGQPGAYNNIPPQQGQFYGDGQGYIPPAQRQFGAQ